MNSVFLAWKPYCTRSQNIAGHLGVQNVYIYPFSSDGNIFLTVLRYLVSSFGTLFFLIKNAPSIIFTLNQPPPLIVLAALYSGVFGKKYVLDSHSAPFNDRKWAWFRPVYKMVARNAFFNINTNQNHKQLVQSWGGKSYIIGDVPIDFKERYRREDIRERSVAVVCSFMFDEPLEEIWAAARITPDVDFHVTGNFKKAPKTLLENVPENIILEGFMPRKDYLGLVSSVKAVVALTTRDFTMQMGGYEALSLEQPIVTSDWPILRESFGEGAVYVDNTPESIHQGVIDVIDKHEAYLRAVAEQRKTRRRYFNRVQQEILQKIKTA